MPAMASRGRGRRTINEINMVPFIDVMLVLLIIFMVTAPMLTPGTDGWRDAAHTLRGAAAGIGAGTLAAACAAAEAAEKAEAPPLLNRVRDALDAALADVAAFRHELMLRSLKG